MATDRSCLISWPKESRFLCTNRWGTAILRRRHSLSVTISTPNNLEWCSPRLPCNLVGSSANIPIGNWYLKGPGHLHSVTWGNIPYKCPELQIASVAFPNMKSFLYSLLIPCVHHPAFASSKVRAILSSKCEEGQWRMCEQVFHYEAPRMLYTQFPHLNSL